VAPASAGSVMPCPGFPRFPGACRARRAVQLGRDDAGMSVWVTSVLIPVGVALATTVATGVTVGPRLAGS